MRCLAARRALSYSSELTSIRSFHRICDGLRTVALVDREGLMVELVDITEWGGQMPNANFPYQARGATRHITALRCAVATFAWF